MQLLQLEAEIFWWYSSRFWSKCPKTHWDSAW